MSDHEQQAKPDGGASELTARLGAAVIVDGAVVAWFDDFTEEAREWRHIEDAMKMMRGPHQS